jgi:hypothetical protein
MSIRITWVEKATGNAACIGLDETVEHDSLDGAEADARYHGECQGIDLDRYEPIAEEVS